MRTRTRLDHEQRIEEAVQYILDHLDEPITPSQIADSVCLSRFHFHRVFQALLGETVGDLHRRFRLERAASRLRAGEGSITEVAFDAGYATHEAFIRAFKGAFGMTPSQFRAKTTYPGELPAVNGAHFGAFSKSSIRFVSSQGAPQMEVEIKQMAPSKAACMSHKGHYFMIGTTFSKFFQWAGMNQKKTGQGIGFYYDDPTSTPPDDLRSDAGALVDADFVIDNPEVHLVDIPGGSYAVYTHHGPYDSLGHSWNEFMSKWFPSSGYEFAQGGAPFELYVNNCMDTAPDQLITELWVGVKAK
jgi:AraC family transcriptional regulator